MMIKLSYSAMAAAGLALAFTTIPFVSPAMAQGQAGAFAPRGAQGCPQGYSRGSSTGNNSAKRDPKVCYPSRSNPPRIYEMDYGSDTCPSGMRPDNSGSRFCTDLPSTTYTDPTFGNLTKANEYDRCPVGYHTSDSARTTCVSYHQDKSPKSRLKKGAACGPDEVDEWGLWCTSKTTTLTRAQGEDEAISDVNIIFAPAARGATQGADYENTPGLVGIFGRKGGGASTPSSSGSGDSQTAQNSGCVTGSATGAAIGGAMAGEGGAALGSMLGGLGKKKKKQGC